MWNSLECGVLYFEYYNFVYEDIRRFIQHVHWKAITKPMLCGEQWLKALLQVNYCVCPGDELSQNNPRCNILDFFELQTLTVHWHQSSFSVCATRIWKKRKKTIKLWMWKPRSGSFLVTMRLLICRFRHLFRVWALAEQHHCLSQRERLFYIDKVENQL